MSDEAQHQSSDQPSLMDRILTEHNKRIAEKRAVRGVAFEARELARWVRQAHPGHRRYPSTSVVEDEIRTAHRAAGLTGR